MKRLSFTICFILAFEFVIAQDSMRVASLQIPEFVSLPLDTIGNSSHLHSFFERLYLLKKEKRQINIIHIGDSHIQADMLTNMVRMLLQKEFGNAGRGLVFPGKIAHTNEPLNILSSSTSSWEAKRIVFTDNPLPIGIGAMTAKTSQDKATFSLRIKSNPSLDYSSSELNFFFKKDSTSFNLIIKDSTKSAIAYLGAYANDKQNNFSRIHLPFKRNYFEFETQKTSHTQNHFTILGASFTNQNPGIIYHSIGGNGAKFKHYLSAKYFLEQTCELTPDLFIISLGTNEAVDHPNVDKNLSIQIEDFIRKLNSTNPSIPIILTTPADFYKKKTRRNPGVEEVRSVLLDVSQKNKLALWDLYTISGGKHSADKWKKFELLQKDGIHATRKGYELQGQLLFSAFMNSYKNYVEHRHP